MINNDGENEVKRWAQRSGRSLVVTDDALLRREYFSESAKVLKKLDRLEKAVDHFFAAEQKLFSDWLALTFRLERNYLDEKQDQYRALRDFHNSIIATSMMLKIDLWQAYRLLKNEKERYACAGAAEKLRIDDERRRRLEYAEAEMNREYGYDPEDDAEGEAEEDASLDETTEPDQSESDPDTDDFAGFKDSKFERSRPEAAKLESIKILYRKLVRRLHPDLQQEAGTGESLWMAKTWLQVQDAYKTGDQSRLERLMAMLFLRTNDLNALTVSEILESRQWLKDDLRELESVARRLRKSPAWGFSKKKDLGPVTKKIRVEFQLQFDAINHEINDLREWHRILEERPRRVIRTAKSRRRQRSRRGASQTSLF